MPKPKSLAGRIAYVTGGAGGIGGATALRLIERRRLRRARRHRPGGARRARRGVRQDFGKDVVAGVVLDVTDEAGVATSFVETVLAFGGVDIVVSNAGIASAAPFEDTTLELWKRTWTSSQPAIFSSRARRSG